MVLVGAIVFALVLGWLHCNPTDCVGPLSLLLFLFFCNLCSSCCNPTGRVGPMINENSGGDSLPLVTVKKDDA